MTTRDFQTNDGIEHHFGDDEDLEPLEAARAAKIDYLVEEEFPDIGDEIGLIISRARVRYDLPPNHPEVANAIFRHMGSNTSLDDLKGIPHAELERLRQRATEDDDEAVVLEAIGVWAKEWDRRVDELNNLEPEDLARLYSEAVTRADAEYEAMDAEHDVLSFINEPSSRADFRYWGLLPSWTTEEAVALALDKNPGDVNLESIKEYRAVASHSPFVRQFMQRLHLVERAVSAGHLESAPTPKAFAKWAIGANVPLGTDFLVWAHAGGHGSGEQEAAGHSEWSDTRIKSTMYKIFIGMAVAQYDLDPKFNPSERSGVFTKIAEDLEAVGLSVDAKTLRKHAKLAMELFDRMDKSPTIRPKRF